MDYMKCINDSNQKTEKMTRNKKLSLIEYEAIQKSVTQAVVQRKIKSREEVALYVNALIEEFKKVKGN